MSLFTRVTLLALAALGAAAATAPALAQPYIRADCRTVIARPRLPDELTANWYRRFWTGECGALHGCIAGAPNWNGVVGELAGRSAPKDRPAVRARACRLGELIGAQWTRPRAVRRIDSGDLRAFKATLDHAPSVADGLARVEAQARAKVRGAG